MEKALQIRTPPTELRSVAPRALYDSEVEAVRFLSDVAMEIHYGTYAERGMKIQTFLSVRRLAFMDEFEDIPETTKAEQIRQSLDGISAFREMPVYLEIREKLRSAVSRIHREDGRQFIERVAPRVRNNLERLSRTDNEALLKDAGRAAAEITERDIPKIGRLNEGKTAVLLLPESVIENVARAFREANKALPVIDVTPPKEEK